VLVTPRGDGKKRDESGWKMLLSNRFPIEVSTRLEMNINEISEMSLPSEVTAFQHEKMASPMAVSPFRRRRSKRRWSQVGSEEWVEDMLKPWSQWSQLPSGKLT